MPGTIYYNYNDVPRSGTHSSGGNELLVSCLTFPTIKYGIVSPYKFLNFIVEDILLTYAYNCYVLLFRSVCCLQMIIYG